MNEHHTPIQQKLKKIRCVIFDVDGVLTDGRLYYDNQGNEFKAFHAHDGHGMKMLQLGGIPIAIITARQSELVSKRMQDLGIEHVFQGARDKLAAFETLLARLELTPDQVCYVGDDCLDLPVMRRCGLAIAVANAQPISKRYAHLVTEHKGGEGAAREVCELILEAQGKLEDLLHHHFR
jgi:3-deoxy-D-manno-octulosonate 8-phosphate phosphatase (KDO 8-P phosphatase)